MLAIEALGSLLLVFVLFSLFIGLLHALFPAATPLKELMEGGIEPGGGHFAGGNEPAAMLSSLQHDVRFRRGNSVAWGGASEGLPLYSQDAVQTLDHSGATVSFAPSDKLLLGSNSLIVVTRLTAPDDAGPKAYRVHVEGELRGSLSAARKLTVEVAAAGHVARISPGVARFRVVPNGKRMQSLAVYAGEAVIAGKGGPVRVRAHYGVTLEQGRVVGRPVPLPAAPAIAAQKALYHYRLLPPKVLFRWHAPRGEFHFQLARDPNFTDCLLEEKIVASGEAGDEAHLPPSRPPHDKGGASGSGGVFAYDFVTGNLSKGRYFWRVSRIDEGREGAFSRTGECELIEVADAPPLTVAFPSERVAVGTHLLTGAVPPGSRVYVNGGEVVTDNAGSFERPLAVKPGVNLIRVEALDAAGNASYASRIVYGKAQPSEPTAPAAGQK